ncbi:ADAMTS-like protein 1 [Palaemon carinicauda]|uniref:ADAMTS-like protein 1 n=1 Tax=Palaemon carinicauda TaxID=392227 RepID=UPI0035B68223
MGYFYAWNPNMGYMTGNWTECSVKCGEGVRNRSVTCKIFLEFSRTVAVLPDDQCPGVKPPQSQRCVLPPCSHAMTRHDYPAGEVSDAAHDPPIASLEDAQEDLDFPEDHKIHETPFLPRLVDEDAPSTSLDVVKETSLSVPQAEAYNEPRRGLHSFEAPSNSHHQKDPLLLYTDESKGRSQYESYELSRGKSHSASEHSQINSIEIDMGGGDSNFLESYNVDVSGKASLYEWMTSGFGPCSASCLGGVQESLVKCIRIADQKIVEPQNCNREERPDIITRTCNDQSCPPRWNVSEFGECSKQCGGGVQMREVKCIHEVTRGGTNTVVVPDSLCPQPPKRTQQYCNILDCPPEWVSSDWSKCSAPCGGGIKTRTVKCQQVMALGQLEERPSRECPFRRPRDRRKCNQRPCQGGVVGTEKSIIRSQTHQDYVQSKFMKKLTLKIGGKATVFRGMRLKVKCPVRRFDRSKITWWHDGRQIGRSGAIKSTQKGVLKIKKVQYPDAGLYKCKADRSEANLTLVVIPLPSSYSSSETYETRRPSVSSANEVSLHTHEDATSTDFTYGWRTRKPSKELGRESRRRQGGRNSARRRNGFKGLQITETTLRPVQPFPIGPNTDTLGEGPFKASSKNMHTVEMTSGEATNVYDTTDWQTDSRKSDDEYVYGTVTHHMKPGFESEDTLSGTTTDHNPTHSHANQLPEEKTISEETGHIYGKVNHHSDGSRITSEENPIFGTVFHNPITGTSSRGYSPPRRTEWPSLTTSTEYHSTGTKSIYEEETGNSIEGDLKDLGNKLSLSSEHGSHIDEHRHPSFSWSGQHLGSWSGHSSRSRPGQSDTHMSGHSKDHWSETEGTPPSWDSSFATVSNNPPSWHSWANTQDQHLHNQQPYEPPGTPYWHAEAPPSLPPAPPITSSGSSRSMPYFQKLLSNLESDDDIPFPKLLFVSLLSVILSRSGLMCSAIYVLNLPTKYMTGNWSECSVKCGEGVRNRSVTCKIFLEFSRTVAVLPDDQCPGVKPPQSQRCVLPPCSHAMTRHDYPAGEVSDAAHDPPIASLEDAQEDIDFPEDHKIHETPFLPRLVDEDAQSTSLDVVKETSLSVPQAEAYNEPRRGLHSFEAPSNSHHQKDPLLLYTDESKGRSQYESYELSRGKSHSASEHSQINSIEIDMGGGDTNFLESYNVDVSGKASLYEWMTSGFGPCSASCLGGVQESLVKCIRIADQKIVEPQNCNREERPDIITRTCNDQSCPPRWNVSEFGECSKPCGGGVQMREVKCIHEVTRGGTNTVVVPDSLCPQPPKRTQQYCNILDCPPEWVSSDWSKCSAPCGGGMKTRTVKCQQVMALGQLEERPSRECPFRRPRDRRKCNQRPCQGGVVGTEKSIIRSQTHQDYVQSKFMKKLTLKIGGKATVFRGMRLKVKCPVRRFDRSKITWWHDGRQIGRSGAIKSTQKGVLKIKKVQYPDAGLYKCKADRSEANLTLVVIPLPSSYSSSETYETRRPSVSSANEVSLHTHEDATSTDFTYDWRPRKPGKELGRESRRRQGGRNSARRRNGFKGLQITETTLRPVQPFPIGPNTDTLGEGPFKASSKNMHTVEMTSGEATNVYDTTDWQTDSRKSDDEYVYGTVTHHMKPGVESEDTLSGTTTDHNPTHSNANQLPEEKTMSEETGHIYGKINHHSDGSRITSEENPIFGTVFHNPITGTSGRGYSPPRRTEWPSLTTSTEYHSTGTKSIYEEETGNSIEGDLKDLGNKLSLSSEHGSHIDEHRHPSFSWSGQHLGSWSGHSSRSRPGQSDTHMSGHSKDHWSETEGTPPSWDSSFATVSNNPPSWHSWANTQDQHLHNQQPYEPPGTPYWHAEAPPSLPPAPPITSSGSSRSMPYFQKLLSNLESFLPASLQRSRGGRHANSPSDGFGGLVSHGLVRDETTTEDPFGTPENLGKGTRDSLEFEWQMTNWSECSQTCGFTSTSSGFQVRSIQCLVRVNNVSRPVDGALCQDAGLEAPVTMQKCGLTECPQWHFDEWSECESSRCYTLNKAFQRRNVVCQLHNGTIVNSEQCDVRTRPRHRQECYNQHCTGVWRVGDWSECTAPCGGHGYRTRLLQCVWNGTKKAAGNACRELPRPEVVRWCDGQPCPDPSLEKTSGAKDCRDRNKYCNIVRRVNMCRVQNYREQCCRSCP